MQVQRKRVLLGLQGRLRMATVFVPLDTGTIQERMREMRLWLDSKHIEPTLFTYVVEMRGPMVKIDFGERKQAEAFATEFVGNLI
jgi:phage tail tube protein FII